ncbi:MAG: serine/threonine-protein kinase [Candidatus Xenobia bacterium]
MADSFHPRYQLLETKSGGLGEVYVCLDKNLNRKVAIKATVFGNDKGRFFDELTSLQKIHSKHVIEIYDLIRFGTPRRDGIVEEFVEGNDLSSLPMDIDATRLLRIMHQIACGLSDLHSNNIIHRDLKPGNVRISHNDMIKIIDFNLSRSRPGEFKTVGFQGTHGYAAPEQHQLGVVTFTHAIDVFAFAATIASILNGGPLPEILESPPRPDEWVQKCGFGGLTTTAAIDVPTMQMLNACLSSDPNDRPRAADVSETIGRAISKNNHRALLMLSRSKRTYVLSMGQRRVNLAHPADPEIAMSLAYDGLTFSVTSVMGDVRINNRRPTVGTRIDGSVLIALTPPPEKGNRIFVTMDISHPAVIV